MINICYMFVSICCTEKSFVSSTLVVSHIILESCTNVLQQTNAAPIIIHPKLQQAEIC
jgi:hypothetical protein